MSKDVSPSTEPHLLQRKPFNPEQFFGQGWSIDEEVGGRIGNNLDAGRIITRDYLCEGKSYINGEDRLRRIKASPKDIQLDANDFLALWQEKGHVTLKWLYDTKVIIFLSFWATILRDPGVRRGVLCLLRFGDGSWGWRCYWVDNDRWDASYPAAVLASTS